LGADALSGRTVVEGTNGVSSMRAFTPTLLLLISYEQQIQTDAAKTVLAVAI